MEGVVACVYMSGGLLSEILEDSVPELQAECVAVLVRHVLCSRLKVFVELAGDLLPAGPVSPADLKPREVEDVAVPPKRAGAVPDPGPVGEKVQGVVVVDLNGRFFLQVDSHLECLLAVSGVVVVCVPSSSGNDHTIMPLLGISRNFPVFLEIPRPALYISIYII